MDTPSQTATIHKFLYTSPIRIPHEEQTNPKKKGVVSCECEEGFEITGSITINHPIISLLPGSLLLLM